MKLCDRCAVERDKWLDARMPPTLSITYGSGAAYDSTARGAHERRQARGREWWALVRRQIEHIRELCAAGKHA